MATQSRKTYSPNSTRLANFVAGINFILYVTTSSRMQDMYKRFLRDMWAKLACEKASVRTLSRNITSLSESSTPGGPGHHGQETVLSVVDCNSNSGPGQLDSETTVTEWGLAQSSLSIEAWNKIVQQKLLQYKCWASQFQFMWVYIEKPFKLQKSLTIPKLPKLWM